MAMEWLLDFNSSMTSGSDMDNSRYDDWEEHWVEKHTSSLINPAQLYRQRLLLRFLNLSSGEMRIVDIGSGTGEFLALLRRKAPHAELLGLEVSLTGIALAQEKLNDAYFLQVDISQPIHTSINFRNWGTQAVCSEVLEHVDDPVSFLRQAARFLAPGARLVVTVPGGPISAFDRHIGHRRHYSAPELSKLLGDAGFEVDFATGAGFPFFNLYRLLVLARGRRLVGDAKGQPSLVMLVIARIFRALMQLNATHSGPGWQTIASARKPMDRSG